MDTTVSAFNAGGTDLPMIVQYCQTFPGSLRSFVNVYCKYVLGTFIRCILTRENPKWNSVFEIG